MKTFTSLPKIHASVIAFVFKKIGPSLWIGNCSNGIDYYAGQAFEGEIVASSYMKFI